MCRQQHPDDWNFTSPRAQVFQQINREAEKGVKGKLEHLETLNHMKHLKKNNSRVPGY